MLMRKRRILPGLVLCLTLSQLLPLVGPLQQGVAVQAAAVETMELAKSSRSYFTAIDARSRRDPAGSYLSSRHFVFQRYAGMINITKQAGKAGAWINPGDNPAPRVNHEADPALGRKLSVNRMYNTIRNLTSRFPNRVFGTKWAALAARYLEERIKVFKWYDVTREKSQAPNPLLGGERVDVINVVARPKNFDPAKQDVVFVAHYDTVRNTPVANDNGSGVAMVLELCRYFSLNKADFNPIILFSGGEEKGKPGTADFIRRYGKRLSEKTEVVINLDMVGYGSNYQIWNLNKRTQAGTYPQLAYVIGKELGLRISLKRNQSGIADYKLFEEKGIPTVTFMNITDQAGHTVPYYHTPKDTLDRISKKTLANTAAMVMNLMEYLNRKY